MRYLDSSYHVFDSYASTIKCNNIGIDTNIVVIVVSLTTWEAHHKPRVRPPQVINEITMAEIEASISILS